MKIEGAEWNGEPVEAEIGTLRVIDDPHFPLYWARVFVGATRQVVRVTPSGGKHFFIDNEDGSGWKKVTRGGCMNVPHRSINGNVFEPLEDLRHAMDYFDTVKSNNIENTSRNYATIENPEMLKKSDELVAAMKERIQHHRV